MKKIRRQIFCILAVLFMLGAVPELLAGSLSLTEVQAAEATLNKSKVSLIKGQTYQLELKGYSKKIKWSTSNRNIVAVNSKGKILARGKGSAVITAKAGTKKYTCRVVIVEPKLSREEMKVYVGARKTIQVTGTSRAVTWSTSNKKVAIVDANGVVTGMKPGAATITAQISNMKYECQVTVLANKNITPWHNTVKNNIMRVGKKDAEGNSYLVLVEETEEGFEGVWNIVYEEKKNRFNFVFAHKFPKDDDGNEPEILFNMYVKTAETNFLNPRVYLVEKGEDYGVAAATFAASSFTNKTKANFRILYGFENVSKKETKNICNDLLQIAFMGWAQLLEEQADVNIQTLGFKSYKIPR